MKQRILVALLSSWLFCGVANAQTTAGYPNKPVKVVIPYGPGGPLDFEARLYLDRLQESMGQPFVFDFKPGAGSSIGIAYVAKAAPDGYTLLVAQGGSQIAAATQKDLPYDPVKDFAPIALMSKRFFLLMAPASSPFNSAREYFAHARAKPGDIQFAIQGKGGGFHLAGAWLHSLTGGSVTYIPYAAAARSSADLLAGRLHASFVSVALGIPQLKAGKLKALGVSSAERIALLPDVPTLAEQGAAGYEFPGWLGFVAPAGTPVPIINRLNAELVKTTRIPDIVQKLADTGGGVMVGSTPAQLGQLIATEVARWRQVVQDTRMELE